MCSLQPESWDTAAEDQGQQQASTLSCECVKCKDKPASIILRDASYCGECFKIVFSHKVRMVIGKAFKSFELDQSSLLLNTRAEKIKILLALPSSINSAVLLHAVLEPYLSAPSRPCPFEFVAVHIVQEGNFILEERSGKIEKNIVEEQNSTDKTFYEICQVKYNIAAHMVPLSSIFPAEGAEKSLQKLWTALPNQTLRDSALNILSDSLLLKVAKEHSCSVVFLATGSQENAISLISIVAQGNGYNLPIETAPFYSKRISASDAIHIVKPLRDIPFEELLSYFSVHHLDSLFDNSKIPNLKVNSIQELTKSFLLNLQSSFPSTISTVTRTGTKIFTKTLTDSFSLQCSLCHMQVQDGGHAWRERTTIRTISETAFPINNQSDKFFARSFCNGCEYFRSYLDLFPASIFSQPI